MIAPRRIVVVNTMLHRVIYHGHRGRLVDYGVVLIDGWKPHRAQPQTRKLQIGKAPVDYFSPLFLTKAHIAHSGGACGHRD